MHCVVRPGDLRAHRRNPAVPYPVRVVTDLTDSGVNDLFDKWRFRIGGASAAVRLFNEPHLIHMGGADISKHFPSLPLGLKCQNYCWIRDPRSSTTWSGHGPPSAEWLRFHAARRRARKRYPPFRRWTGVLLGFTLSPAFACAVTGEIGQFLAALGISSVWFVDDVMIVNISSRGLRRDLLVVVSLLTWLGFRCNAAKTIGPVTEMNWIGLRFAPRAGHITVTDERTASLLVDLDDVVSSRRVRAKLLESILGKLVSVSCILRGSSPFTARMRAAHLRAVRAGSRRAAVTPGMIADVRFWRWLLTSRPVGSRILFSGEVLDVVTIKSDSSGDMGWGYVFGGALHFSRLSSAVVEHEHIQTESAALILRVGKRAPGSRVEVRPPAPAPRVGCSG